MIAFVSNFIHWLDSSKYLLLFFGAVFEGPVVMLTGGFMHRLGQVYFIPMYLSLLAGDLLADIGWYFIGYYGAGSMVAKYGHFFNITPEIIAKVEQRFRKYQNSILIVSKLTMGFGFSIATLVTAGLMKISIRKFMIINLIGGIIWTLFMVAMGYMFGNIYLVVPESLKIAFIGVLLLVVIFVLRTVNRYLVNTKI